MLWAFELQASQTESLAQIGLAQPIFFWKFLHGSKKIFPHRQWSRELKATLTFVDHLSGSSILFVLPFSLRFSLRNSYLHKRWFRTHTWLKNMMLCLTAILHDNSERDINLCRSCLMRKTNMGSLKQCVWTSVERKRKKGRNFCEKKQSPRKSFFFLRFIPFCRRCCQKHSPVGVKLIAK